MDWQENIETIGIVYTDIYSRKNTLIWNEFETLNFDRDKFEVDLNGQKGKEMIYKKDKSSGRSYDQVFSLTEVGRKVSWVLT